MDEVRAAGAVVHRDGDGGIEVLLVHRPKYDDWTFPKGKLDPGETFEDAAVREVEEEAGIRGTLGPELPSTRYIDTRGRPKVVRWWGMALAEAGGVAAANNEVDEIRWLSIDAARRQLTHDRDHVLLDALTAALDPTS
jgi:8-oxo-dGTP pyrophosphatase MutT (NUDIX family)